MFCSSKYYYGVRQYRQPVCLLSLVDSAAEQDQQTRWTCTARTELVIHGTHVNTHTATSSGRQVATHSTCLHPEDETRKSGGAVVSTSRRWSSQC
jgi:hypothetical protein